MRIAAAQIACVPGDISANLAKMRDFALRAKDRGAELMVFPEMADTGYSMRVIQHSATSWEQGAVPELRALAKELALRIISGVSEREGLAIYNTQVFIDVHGEIAGKYRKTHLFSLAPIEEHNCFSAGGQMTVIKADGFRFGLSICYDLRFPEFHRSLACEHGANVLVISSAWPFPRVEHLRVLATARAIENQSYLVLANRVGTDDGVTFCGNSAIIDPSGVIIAAASSDREEMVQAEASADLLNSVRERMPVFAHRRQDLYAARDIPLQVR